VTCIFSSSISNTGKKFPQKCNTIKSMSLKNYVPFPPRHSPLGSFGSPEHSKYGQMYEILYLPCSPYYQQGNDVTSGGALVELPEVLGST
jgi:hypothetical protein